MNVVKRSGTKEPLDVEKIHKAVAWACEGINNVSVSDVMMEAQPQFHNNIRTENIHRVIVDGAAKLINSNSNYQYVASKLLVFDLYQKVYGSPTPSHLYETVKSNCALGVYDKDLLSWYSEDEWNIINGYIKHNRDYSLTYAAVSQILDKYLVQDRQSRKYYETPQVMFILIAAVAFRTRPNRLKLIKDTYNLLSTFKISLPTPILAGLRTTTKQFSSCVLMDIGDDLSSITDGASAITKYAAKRAGLGINGGRIRAVGSKVGNGEIVHTGVTPFYRQFESALKSCSQGGIRDACVSSTSYVDICDGLVYNNIYYKINDYIETIFGNISVIDVVNFIINLPKGTTLEDAHMQRVFEEISTHKETFVSGT